LGGLNPAPVAGDHVVVYNLGIPGADAYAGNNRATIQSVNASGITLTASHLFPLASPSHRFQVVPNADQAVFYVCANAGIDAAGNGTGTLFRLSQYGINGTAPAACPATPAGTPILADRISACAFSYAADVSARNGLVTMRLATTESNETVSLYQEVHVNNAP
jgi:MSHA biogenesis protein MshO